MIRELTAQDTEQVMAIWLNTNFQAHHFIVPDFWFKNYNAVRDSYLPMSQTYVYEENGIIKGFVSLIGDDYLGALFVAPQYQNEGIGRSLLSFILRGKTILHLAVYAENLLAVRFYHRLGFKIVKEQRDDEACADELLMCWTQSNISGDHIYNYPVSTAG